VEDGGATGSLAGVCSVVGYVSGVVGGGVVVGDMGSTDGGLVMEVDVGEFDEAKRTTSALIPNAEKTSRASRIVNMTHHRVRASTAPPDGNSRIDLEDPSRWQLSRIQTSAVVHARLEAPGYGI
jgi:hypothetical protein